MRRLTPATLPVEDVNLKNILRKNMNELKYKKELYPKAALLKAAYSFTDSVYVHLDSDDEYYYVAMLPKEGHPVPDENEFTNEILSQTVRHEIYLETKNIRELMYARAMATTVIGEPEPAPVPDTAEFDENEIIKDWFENNHEDT